MSKLALLDGDMIVFRIAAAAEQATDWGNGLWTLHSDEIAAQQLLDSTIEKIMEQTECDDARPAYSGRNNFRKQLYPDYKANRKGKRLPMLLKPLIEYSMSEHNGFIKDELEADDVLGIWQTRAKPLSTVIVSGDKDMRTVPGLHFNPQKADEGVVRVTEAQAQRFHMVQTLTGDTVDNIPGCPKYGPVKADRAVPEGAHLIDQWEAVCDCFINAGLTPDDALLNARLTRILQSNNYDFEVSEVILWEPPQ